MQNDWSKIYESFELNSIFMNCSPELALTIQTIDALVRA